jgi:toxin ParE1/3/4
VRYLGRIQAYCSGLREFPARGTRRDDVLEGLRIIGFERRVSIAFRIVGTGVVILRVLYGGRQFESSVEE